MLLEVGETNIRATGDFRGTKQLGSMIAKEINAYFTELDHRINSLIFPGVLSHSKLYNITEF